MKIMLFYKRYKSFTFALLTIIAIGYDNTT